MKTFGQLVTSKQKLVSTSNKLTSLEIQERALVIADGLTSTEKPNDMTAWYCKAYKILGEGKYTAIAQAARKENSKKLFGWLLKQELNKKATQ
jgi:hypothetical protein